VCLPPGFHTLLLKKLPISEVELIQTQKQINLLLIEDNRLLREGWEMILEAEPEFKITGSYGCCEDAFKCASIGTADIIIMDINLPGISGIEGIKLLRCKNPAASVVMCSNYEDDENIFSSILAGVIGFIAKKTPPTELIKTIKIYVEGGSTLSPEIAKKIIIHSQLQSHGGDRKEYGLLPEDFTLLNLVSLGKSLQTIADTLSLSVLDVKKLVRNIYKKLQMN